MQTEHRSLGDVIADPHNARKHTARNMAMIERSLHEVGAARSIVIDENDTILAGNATVEAAMSAGFSRMRIIDADGHELIAVRRRNLTDDQKTLLSVYDNRSAELADWHAGTVLALADTVDLSGAFNEWEIRDLEKLAEDLGRKEQRADEKFAAGVEAMASATITERPAEPHTGTIDIIDVTAHVVSDPPRMVPAVTLSADAIADVATQQRDDPDRFAIYTNRNLTETVMTVSFDDNNIRYIVAEFRCMPHDIESVYAVAERIAAKHEGAVVRVSLGDDV